MAEPDRTKAQLLAELEALHSRVAELELADEALGPDDEGYGMLIEAMDKGQVAIDENMVITSANRSFCKMVGYERRELVGRGLAGILDKENQAAFARQFASSGKGKRPGMRWR